MAATLTAKQESFCQAYIKLGDKSAAYREVYDTSKMKPASVNRLAVALFDNIKITSRVAELQNELKKRNDVSIDEVVTTLANMLRFDIADLYKEDGSLKPIKDMSKEARLMIQQLDTDEIFIKGKTIGLTKKVKTYSKVDAIEKLMKYLGGYEKDNRKTITLKDFDIKSVVGFDKT